MMADWYSRNRKTIGPELSRDPLVSHRWARSGVLRVCVCGGWAMTTSDLPPMPTKRQVLDHFGLEFFGSICELELATREISALKAYVRRLLEYAQHTKACQVYIHRECDCNFTRDRAFIEQEIGK
jgi:hypothetical protein